MAAAKADRLFLAAIQSACAVWCVTEHAVNITFVRGDSMLPTIQPSSLLITNKLEPRFLGVSKGDVVVVRSPTERNKLVCKRVAALPGELVRVRPPAWDKHNLLRIDKRAEVVPEGHVFLEGDNGHVFLEGDNCDASIDSRSYGSVPQALITGTVAISLVPPGRVGPAPPRAAADAATSAG